MIASRGSHGLGPRARLALVRPAGRMALTRARQLAQELRADGYMVADIGSASDARRPPERLHGAADPPAYDLVLSIGSLLPMAVQLAVDWDAPIACLDLVVSSPALIDRLLDSTTRQVPLLRVDLDGDALLTLSDIDVRGERPLVVDCADPGCHLFLERFQVRATTDDIDLLSGSLSVRCERVTVTADTDARPFRVCIDGTARSASRIRAIRNGASLAIVEHPPS